MKFTLWKNNKIDQEYEMSLEEIRKAYRKFCEKKQKEDKVDWLIYYAHQTVTWFVGAKEEEGGLQSVVEQDDYITLQNKLMDVRHEFYPKDLK